MSEEEYERLVALRKMQRRSPAKAVPALLRAPQPSYRFTVPGEPVPKARPRMTKTGHVYTPQRTVEAENAIQSCATLAGVKPLVGPIRLECEFLMPRPKVSKHSLPDVRPDLDNMAKTVLDALNGLAYRDDGQIVQLHVSKRYADSPMTIISIEGFNEADLDAGTGPAVSTAL